MYTQKHCDTLKTNVSNQHDIESEESDNESDNESSDNASSDNASSSESESDLE